MDNILFKNMLTSFAMSIALGVIMTLATGIGIVGIATMGISQAIIMIYLYVNEHELSNLLTDSLSNYIFKPLEDDDYLKITIKTPSGTTANKMVSMLEFDELIGTLKESDDVSVLGVEEYIHRTGNEPMLTSGVQKLVDK